MKTKSILLLVLFNLVICTSLLAQTTKHSTEKTKNSPEKTKQSTEKAKEKGAPQVQAATDIKQPEKIIVNPLLLQDWKFHAITIRTPKDGYLMRFSDREVTMVNWLIANYSFNKDGSIALDPRYMQEQGVKEAKWKMTDSLNIEITYFWTVEKQKKAGYTNGYEKLDYRIDMISEKELSLNMQNMFIVNLVIK